MRDKIAIAAPLNGDAEVRSEDRSRDTNARPKPETEGPTFGAFLIGARERRGVSRDNAAREAHVPDHYVQMMETNDYSMISDQLYLLPFLRRYATFLALDPEETVMRFVREVQHADNVPAARSIERIEMDRPRSNSKGRGWSRPTMVIVAIAALLVAWLAESRYRQAAADSPAAKAATDQNAQNASTR